MFFHIVIIFQRSSARVDTIRDRLFTFKVFLFLLRKLDGWLIFGLQPFLLQCGFLFHGYRVHRFCQDGLKLRPIIPDRDMEIGNFGISRVEWSGDAYLIKEMFPNQIIDHRRFRQGRIRFPEHHRFQRFKRVFCRIAFDLRKLGT